MSIDVVVGGMYGSEAKGHATQRLVERRVAEHEHVTNIRTGGPNAGHTGYDWQGRKWAFRQIPVGAVVKSPLMLVIAAGSEIDLPVLLSEIDLASAAGLLDNKDLLVHGEATLIESRHKKAEGVLVDKIGSTGKGIGAARADRIHRQASRLIDSPAAVGELEDRGVGVVDGDRIPYDHLIVEGTQGYALGLHSGYYPTCTTSDCRAVDFLSMAGVSPWSDEVTVWVVGRVYPIRVAGNSGPMANETSWEVLGLPEERTTVTQKVRRVGLPDWDLMRRAVVANGGPSPRVRAALSMVDQFAPRVSGVPWSETDPRWVEVEDSIRKIEFEIGAEVNLVMSGPDTAAWRHY